MVEESPLQLIRRRFKQALLLLVILVPVAVGIKMLGFLIERTFYILVFVAAVAGTLWLERKARKR